MWLTLDIGNSALKGGLFDDEQIEHVFHVELSPALREDAAAWRARLTDELAAFTITRIGITSVVPAITAHVKAGLRATTDAPAQRIDATCRLPFELDYATPGTLGADRLAAAAAAWTRYGTAHRPMRNVVAIDAGTAVTCEVIARPGRYRGGTIAPGPALMRRALHRGTAQLPDVPLRLPETPIGRSTNEALQAGIMYGTIDSVRGHLRRIRDELDAPPVVVLTGGWQALLHKHVDAVDHVDPHLVLRGIRTLLALNRPAR